MSVLPCLLAIPSHATEDKANTELATYPELAQTRLEATRDLLQKDIQALSTRIDTQDKRLDTQNAHIDQNLSLLGNLLAGLGIVLALAGFGGYFTVRGKAKEEAKAEAERWFQEQAKDLQTQLKNLQDKLRQMEGQAETHFNSYTQKLDEQLVLAMQQVQQNLAESGKPNKDLLPEAAKALADAEQAAKDKPESQYTFEDWNYRAYAAYSQGDKEGAARYWQAAARHPSSSGTNKAKCQFYVGVVLGELGRLDEAIAAYDEVVTRFGQNVTPAIKEQIAKALVNKGVSLGQQGKNEEAFVAYDEVIQRFGQDDAPAIKEAVAKALFNKGVSLGQQGKNDEAITAYDEVVKRFGQDDSPAIKEAVAHAQNGMGFALLCRAKEHWGEADKRVVDLRQAAALFAEADAGLPDNGVILGNKAYCAHLLEQPEAEVRARLTQALRVGGKELYEATLGDLAIHPVADMDAAFRVVLEGVWNRLSAPDAKNPAPCPEADGTTPRR